MNTSLIVQIVNQHILTLWRDEFRDRLDEVLESPASWEEPLELSNFARRQIELSKRLVEACEPRIVVVANGFASKIAKKELELGVLDEDGLLWGQVGERRVPVFLSGMMTGQRALDRGSRDRLEWHLRRTKKLIDGIGR